jgi:hypothetical protein
MFWRDYDERKEIAAQASFRGLRGLGEIDYAKDFAVLFNARVHKNARRFVVPIEVRANFHWTTMNRVGLLIFSDEGECRFCGVQTLKSGPEVYGIDMKCLISGERIYVHAFQPPPED